VLGTKDLVGYSSLRNSSSYWSFMSFPNAGEECYRSLGLRRSLVSLPCL
jgi:hypothetical protein